MSIRSTNASGTARDRASRRKSVEVEKSARLRTRFGKRSEGKAKDKADKGGVADGCLSSTGGFNNGWKGRSARSTQRSKPMPLTRLSPFRSFGG